jgi:Tfp pilus assembly protein PilF
MPKRRTVWDLNEMGLFFYRREAYDLAIGEFKRALDAALFPMAALHVNLAAAYLGKKMYADARVVLRVALRLEPHNQQAHWLLSRIFKATGAVEETVAELERTLAIEPDSPEGHQAAGELRALSRDARRC